MGNFGLKIIGLFLYLFFIYITGSLIFTKGFLLKRDVVDQNSSCQVDFAHHMGGEAHGREGCWLHRRFDKAVFIVIDALRFNFMIPKKEDGQKNAPYENKLNAISHLIKNSPNNARAYKFMADPPTTTLQRLKGLTTGSLPTFVDAGSNFASSEITEDNFIDQLVNRRKKITFMGDDTWMSLFPQRFNRAFPFPSFNVKDLHTVDNGVLEHLYGEMAKPDWDVIIAHFLGVDHCGHRYGPNHPAMADKLTQMDLMIRNVTSRLDKDTVLFVLGDHGMTSTGDHGGDSPDELEAGLFIYSPTQITATKRAWDDYQTVSQIDIVPTVSLLLGLPIPFSNLGSVITDVVSHCSWSVDSHIKEVFHTIEALRLNAQQISTYIDQYVKMSSDLSSRRITLLQQQLMDTEHQLSRLVTELYTNNFADNAHRKLHEIEKQYLSYISQIKSICQEVWAKFDLVSIVLGVLVLCVGLLVNLYVLLYGDISSEGKGQGTCVIVLVVSAVFVIYSGIQAAFMEGSATSIMGFILGAFDVLVIVMIIQVVRKTGESAKTDVKPNKKESLLNGIASETFFSCCVVCFSCLGYFSNSFVVYDDSVSLFFAQSITWIFCIKAVQGLLSETKTSKEHYKTKSKSPKNYDLMKFITQPVFVTVILTFMCNIFLRISSTFRSCREEQVNCTTSSFLHPLSSIGETVDGSKNVRYFLCVVSLLASVYLPRRWLKDYGNLNGSSLPVLFARYLIPSAAVFMALHWAIQGLPERVLDSLPVWQQVAFPQVIYVIIILALLALIAAPLLIYIIPKQGKELSVPTGGKGEELIKKVYNHMKMSWEEPGESSDQASEPPVVYGLATVYSATVVYTGSVLLMLLALLLGDGISPSLMTAVVSLLFFLELFTLAVRVRRETDLLLPGVVTISLLTTCYFYNTGHQATIPSIRFEAAFIGFHGDWENKIIPALLIHLNTFAAEVFFTIISPLLILWPCSKGVISGFVMARKDADRQWRGDYIMSENRSTFMSLLLKLGAILYLINGLKILGSMLAAAVHRRHLMVWKIFAPRFVFQAMSSFSVFGATVLALLLIFRVDRAIDKWNRNLNKAR